MSPSVLFLVLMGDSSYSLFLLYRSNDDIIMCSSVLSNHLGRVAIKSVSLFCRSMWLPMNSKE